MLSPYPVIVCILEEIMDSNLVPKTITILGKKIKITIMELDDSHGDFNSDKMEIRLDREQSNESAHRTLFHESIHAVAFISGWHYLFKDGEEELIVRSIEHGLADLYWLRSGRKPKKPKK